MIRINLLPPEITQRRKSESRIYVMVVVFVLMLLVMGMFAAFMFVQVDARNREVAAAQQELEAVTLQSEQFKVFEDKLADLELRGELVDSVLVGRIDWNRLCQEVSLVLPDDVWLLSMNADEVNGLSISGKAIDDLVDVPDSGHKAIARTLVRLTDLEQLFDVWLTSSVKSSDIESYEEGWLDFQMTASVQEPEETTADGEPAPPAESP